MTPPLETMREAILRVMELEVRAATLAIRAMQEGLSETEYTNITEGAWANVIEGIAAHERTGAMLRRRDGS